MTFHVAASEFKAKCLGLLDRVAETGETIVVTKRGKPLARLAPVESAAPLEGSVTFLVDDDELLEPVLEPLRAETE